MYLLGAATSYIILPPRKYQLVAALHSSLNLLHFSNHYTKHVDEVEV